MNEQEREVIADIFRRLEQVANEPRDAEAERFIAEKLRQQPYASYAMAQTIFIQERALTNLQAEVESLGAEVEEARRRAAGERWHSVVAFRRRVSTRGANQRRTASDASSRGLPVGRAFGASGGARRSGSARIWWAASIHSGPWGNQMGQSRGGGFLQGALSTAAGVAGGMMMANALDQRVRRQARQCGCGRWREGGSDRTPARPTESDGRREHHELALRQPG